MLCQTQFKTKQFWNIAGKNVVAQLVKILKSSSVSTANGHFAVEITESWMKKRENHLITLFDSRVCMIQNLKFKFTAKLTSSPALHPPALAVSHPLNLTHSLHTHAHTFHFNSLTNTRNASVASKSLCCSSKTNYIQQSKNILKSQQFEQSAEGCCYTETVHCIVKIRWC